MGPIDEILQPGITETVVTTLSIDGKPNAAPMGIVRQNDSLYIRMFPGSNTFRNVSGTGKLVINIVDDPVVFVCSAFRDLDESYYVPQPGMPPLITGVYAWVYCEARVEGTVRLTPVKSEIVRRRVPRFSRGFAAVIDAAVTGTRLKFLGEEGKKKIREDAVLVEKCGTPADKEAMRRLKEILDI
ncbi:MAG: hypothetical protein A4E28_02640 [Methanocella sp. PtaU1.Bin125]|nr:MAG: hypothetical protein A4E28_02640 [Methanocella sp. PtaU1.Bin125]